MLLIIGAVVIAGVLTVSGLIFKRTDSDFAGLTILVFGIIAVLYLLATLYCIDRHFGNESKIKDEYDALQYRISSDTLDEKDIKNIKAINDLIQQSRDYMDNSWISIFCIKGIEDYEFLDYPKALKIYAENLLKEAK